MTDDTEDYTPDELDEMLGSVLYHGGIQAALAHFLHVTSDDEDLVLVEFVNHAPVPLAAPGRAATASAVKSSRQRLETLTEATDAAILSLRARVANQPPDPRATEMRAVFEAMMQAEYGEQARQDGIE
jgi:hypothetical protein